MQLQRNLELLNGLGAGFLLIGGVNDAEEVGADVVGRIGHRDRARELNNNELIKRFYLDSRVESISRRVLTAASSAAARSVWL